MSSSNRSAPVAILLWTSVSNRNRFLFDARLPHPPRFGVAKALLEFVFEKLGMTSPEVDASHIRGMMA